MSETAELLHLPEDVLTLTPLTSDASDEHQNDGIYSYIVCAKKLLDKNTTFGPFRAEIVGAGSRSQTADNCSNKVVNHCDENNANNDSTVTVRLKEESGDWLKILRTADKEQEPNATVRCEDGQVWCTILSDISPSNEVTIREPIKFVSDSRQDMAHKHIDDIADNNHNNHHNSANCETTDVDDEDEDGSVAQSLPEDEEEELEVDDDCYTCVPCGIAFSCKDLMRAKLKS
ncbi:unnamed protein product [Oppiella nova]|uniref:SET domain-containing protein n=1 Tax=Oppiella nova TaxID=334625 RepID=A0A7R9LH55_9ACAR|nr:unnamed protein product [Oppiella nova]CAG2162902.1 unnamed protein product [Oppiella nova]